MMGHLPAVAGLTVSVQQLFLDYILKSIAKHVKSPRGAQERAEKIKTAVQLAVV